MSKKLVINISKRISEANSISNNFTFDFNNTQDEN